MGCVKPVKSLKARVKREGKNAAVVGGAVRLGCGAQSGARGEIEDDGSTHSLVLAESLSTGCVWGRGAGQGSCGRTGRLWERTLRPSRRAPRSRR